MTEHEVEELLIAFNLWTYNDKERLVSIPKLLESIHLQMWQSYEKFQSKRVEQLRKQLRKLESERMELFGKSHSYDAYSCEGVASWTKFEYIVGSSIIYNNQPLHTNNGQLISAITSEYLGKLLTDDETRKLAKTPAWKMIWSAAHTEGSLFGKPAAFLSDEQRSIISWSKLYDSVHESMDCPSEDVVEDDDLLDGWMIFERDKREKAKREKSGNKYDLNGKPGTTEIFIPAETDDDAKRIEDMNDPEGRMLKRQRLNLISKVGKMNEQDMPDAKLTMRQQAIQEFQQKARQR